MSDLAPDYWTFIIIHMVVGAATSGVFLVAYVLVLEMVGPSYRMFMGTVCHYFYTIGYVTLVMVAYLLNDDWRLMQIVLCAPSLVFIGYWGIMPESI